MKQVLFCFVMLKKQNKVLDFCVLFLVGKHLLYFLFQTKILFVLVYNQKIYPTSFMIKFPEKKKGDFNLKTIEKKFLLLIGDLSKIQNFS